MARRRLRTLSIFRIFRLIGRAVTSTWKIPTRAINCLYVIVPVHPITFWIRNSILCVCAHFWDWNSRYAQSVIVVDSSFFWIFRWGTREVFGTMEGLLSLLLANETFLCVLILRIELSSSPKYYFANNLSIISRCFKASFVVFILSKVYFRKDSSLIAEK